MKAYYSAKAPKVSGDNNDFPALDLEDVDDQVDGTKITNEARNVTDALQSLLGYADETKGEQVFSY